MTKTDTHITYHVRQNNIQETKIVCSLDNNTRVQLNVNTFDDNNYINASKVDV